MIDSGCVFVIEHVQDGRSGTIFEAFVPGGQHLFDKLDNSTENFYVGTDNQYVIIYSNDDEFVVTAYKGEV